MMSRTFEPIQPNFSECATTVATDLYSRNLCNILRMIFQNNIFCKDSRDPSSPPLLYCFTLPIMPWSMSVSVCMLKNVNYCRRFVISTAKSHSQVNRRRLLTIRSCLPATPKGMFLKWFFTTDSVDAFSAISESIIQKLKSTLKS